MKFNHLKRPYFVSMGTFHMAILLLFNSSDKLRLCDIMEHTKLSEPELKKQLQTLTETKIVIIEVSYLTVVWSTWTSKTFLELNFVSFSLLDGWFYGAYRHFQRYYCYIVAASFIDGGRRSIGRNSPTCSKSLTNFIT